LKIILPLCGYNCLIPTTVNSDDIKDVEKYNIKRKDIEANMIIDKNAYIIIKDSTARITNNEFHSKNLIKKFLQDGNIKLLEDKNIYLFIENTVFTSSSAAASIVLGSSASGNESWLNKDGKKLGEL
jgi:hypothetical protein